LLIPFVERDIAQSGPAVRPAIEGYVGKHARLVTGFAIEPIYGAGAAAGANGAGLVGTDGAKGAGLVGSDMVGIPPLCVLRACYTKFMPRGTPPKKTIAGLTMER
jgi:hypothetical protein